MSHRTPVTGFTRDVNKPIVALCFETFPSAHAEPFRMENATTFGSEMPLVGVVFARQGLVEF